MKRRATAALLGVGLAIIPLQSNAASIAGKPCSREGKLLRIDKQVFTCSRSGKSLTWTIKKSATLRAKLGDECRFVGEVVNTNLQCRLVEGGRQRLLGYASNPAALPPQISRLALEDCRIPDSRAKPIVPQQSIAFPIKAWNPSFTSRTQITVSIVPVDFSDAPASESASQATGRIVEEFKRWTSWYSRDRLSIKWVLPNQWIRAPGTSSDYNWIHPEGNVGGPEKLPQLTIGERLVALADQTFDIDGVQVFYFMYPRGISKIQDSVNFTSTFSTSRGDRWVGVYASSYWLYNASGGEMPWLMHEMIHMFGYMQHAPSFPPYFSLGSSDVSSAMTVWDRMVLDWLEPSDVYCISREQINGQRVTLVPAEREQLGTAGVAIRLDEHTLLIVESHRRDVWGEIFTRGFGGLTAMIVDTTKNTDRSGEWARDDGRGILFERTANYLQFAQYIHGSHPRTAKIRPFELNFLLYPGEHFVYQGLRVEFVSSGANDVVQLKQNP